MSWSKVALLLCVILLAAGASFAWDDNNPPPKAENREPIMAMGFSIFHPGLGEWYNAGWGGWQNCNTRKFWLGFIPFYGCPGYLQIKSAKNARRGGTW